MHVSICFVERLKLKWVLATCLISVITALNKEFDSSLIPTLLMIDSFSRIRELVSTISVNTICVSWVTLPLSFFAFFECYDIAARDIEWIGCFLEISPADCCLNIFLSLGEAFATDSSFMGLCFGRVLALGRWFCLDFWIMELIWLWWINCLMCSWMAFV